MTEAAIETPAPAEELRIVEKHPLAIRWFHWVNFPVLFVMIWSGLMIYWANDVYTFFGLFKVIPQWWIEMAGWDKRLAEGMGWHFFFMWVFTINGLLYVIFLGFSGQWRYMVPTRRSFGEAWQVVLHDLGIRKEPLPKSKFNAAQRLAYTGVVFLGAGSLATGLAIYKPTQLSWPTLLGGYEGARFLHFWLMIGFLGFFLVHVVQVIHAGWANFRSMLTGKELAPRDKP